MSREAEPIMPPDFVGIMQNTTALISAVMQTNLRAAQALLRADNPEAVLALQQRFVREYTAALTQGTMTIVEVIKGAQHPASSDAA